MTTIKTKPKADDPFAELAAIEEQLGVAREERSRLGQEYRQWKDGLAKLQAELDGLATSDPGQFTGGQPKAKTHATEVKDEITKRMAGQKWPQILGGADQRIRDLEAELSRATAANAEGLAHREYEGPGQAAVEKIKRGAALITEGYGEYVASGQRLMGICTATAGLNGQDVLSDPRVAEIAKLISGLDDLAPPRSQSLTPTETWAPRVRVRSGGFVLAGHAHPDDLTDVEQPKPVSV